MFSAIRSTHRPTTPVARLTAALEGAEEQAPEAGEE
jgi:hypothetical protein